MGLCRASRVGFQKDKIIEEILTANYIKKVSKRDTLINNTRIAKGGKTDEYVDKFISE